MESDRHRRQMNLLVESLDTAWSARDDFYVAGDMGLYFSETQALNNDFRAPDVFVVLGCHRHERKRWVVWEEEGLTPDVVIEITSPSTEHVDRGKKKDIYARLLKVAFYAVYDPFSGSFEAWTLDTARRAYVAATPDERGHVHCAPLGLWLGVVHGVFAAIEAPWLRWIDAEGKVLPYLHELLELAHDQTRGATERAEREAARAEREAERAEQESKRAEAALRELEALREELRRRG